MLLVVLIYAPVSLYVWFISHHMLKNEQPRPSMRMDLAALNYQLNIVHVQMQAQMEALKRAQVEALNRMPP